MNEDTDNDLAMSYTNLVNFVAGTPKITTHICVQQASISSGVSLATFVRQRHCSALRRSSLSFVSLLFAMGETAMLGGLHARLGHADFKLAFNAINKVCA